MVSIEFDWEPGDRNPAALATRMTAFEASIRSGGFREPLLESRHILAEEIDTNFAVGGRPPWTALAESTKRQKRRNKERPLIHTGRLRRSAGAVGRWKVKNDEARFSDLPSSVEYGYYHLLGSSRMPVRDWLNVPEGTEDVIGITVFNPWLERKLNEAGI